MSSFQNKLIFKKFSLGKLIHKSDVSLIYEGKNELTQEPVAMKFEKNWGKYELLESEAYLLLLLKGLGIPRVISFGKIKNYKVLVEELLGKTIYLIWSKKINEKNKLNDICLTAIQCINRLEYIHSRNIIHRDIKPFNFVFGRKDPNLIYIIDFGISRKYRSSKTGNHIRYRKLNTINGSMRYMSINCNKGYEQSRRDDLESLGYMLIFLIKKNLPWMKIEKQNLEPKKKFLKICSIKSSIKPEELCSGLPREFCQYIEYCQQLRFEQTPNYNYLRNLFIEVIKSNEKFIDTRFINFIQFSWLNKNNIKKININTKLKGQYFANSKEQNKKGKSFHMTLYRQIKESLGKAKSQEIPDMKKSTFISFKLKNLNIFFNKNTEDMLINSNINTNKINSKNRIGITNFNREKTIQSSIQNPELKKLLLNIPKNQISDQIILSKSVKQNGNIKNLIYSNSSKQIKKYKINIAGKDLSITKNFNKSKDNSSNYSQFKYYRPLQQREKENKKKYKVSCHKKNNLSIEYNIKSNNFLNNKKLLRRTYNFIPIEDDNNDLLLSDRCKTHQIDKKINNI